MQLKRRFMQKSALAMVTSFVLATLIYSEVLFLYHNHIDQKPLVQHSLNHALTVDLILAEKTNVVLTLAEMPRLAALLKVSNDELTAIPSERRADVIDDLNKQWKNAPPGTPPFIQARLESPAALLLRKHQTAHPNQYGEIFLTNVHGVVIGTTGRLSTLAHAHKYWWKAAYADGQGHVFIDDRGYDDSVGEIVLGVVVPVMEDGKLLGILKANLLVKTLLYKILADESEANETQSFIVRSKGKIVAGLGLQPLAESIHPIVQTQMSPNTMSSLSYSDAWYKSGFERTLAGIAPIAVTVEATDVTFGGKPFSPDQKLGNNDEYWAVITTRSLHLSDTLAETALINVVFILVLSLSLLSLYQLTVQHILSPLEKLSNDIAQDPLDKNEETSELKRIQKTFDSLSREIELRKAAEHELVKAKTQAENASRTKSEFLANMSHELRTPLNSIIGFSEMMEYAIKGPLPKDYQVYSKLITTSGRLLLETINSILDLAKIEAGKFELYKEDVYMGDLIDEAVALMHIQANEKGVELVNKTHDLHHLHVDPMRMKQIFMNLIGNAVKFTDHGHIVIGSHCDANGHNITIKDTGIGMTPQQIKLALKPFQQVHGTSWARRYQGTGLGLSLSLQVMHLHGGELKIESQVGQGTTITLHFPPEAGVEL